MLLGCGDGPRGAALPLRLPVVLSLMLMKGEEDLTVAAAAEDGLGVLLGGCPEAAAAAAAGGAGGAVLLPLPLPALLAASSAMLLAWCVLA